MTNFKRCTRCVMDNRSDSTIKFDSEGICNYCTEAIEKVGKEYFPTSDGAKQLSGILSRIKNENKNREYDCIMGISGGLDSSYLAYLGSAKWKLRILAVHVDDGYDTEISKRNITKLCNKAGIKLITIKPDEHQFNELTRAYMFAGVPNLAIPQDNVLFATIYKFMRENRIRTFLSGHNFSLESILQKGNTYDPYDTVNIRDINHRFGRSKIDKLDFISNFQRDIDRRIFKIETPMLLNYIDYNRSRALIELNEYCDFKYYGSKHLENTLTKFIQVYWFYNKFNVDKRSSHLSSMIVSGQMTREEAIEILSQPIYDENIMNREIEMILERLDISKEEFTVIMNAQPRQHTDYRTSQYNKIKSMIYKWLK